jgi:hypothetical protein
MGYRARLWRTIDRKKAAYRSKMKPVFMIALEKQIKPVYEKISETTDIRDIEITRLDNEPVMRAYERLYKSTAFDFAVFDRRNAKSMKGYNILKGEEEIIEDLIMEEILAYLDLHVGETVVAVGNTSLVLIRRLLDKLVPDIVEQGVGAGQAQTMLRDSIKSAWHEAKYFRTERIVRTEVNRAANWGSMKGVKSTEIPHDKVWLSALYANSRPEHTAGDGQKVDIDSAFYIGGESLMFPGDPAGSAGNVINCLCSMTYETKGADLIAV